MSNVEHIPMIAGEPMVCEVHFWRLWPDQDPDCPGPGMPLSGAEGYATQLAADRAETAALPETAVAQDPIDYPPCLRCGRRDGLDAVVPDDVWARLWGRDGILCLWCMDALGEQRGVTFEAKLYWVGKAGRSALPKEKE